jgi:hypothetical protein
MRPKPESKVKRPELKTLPDGRKFYPGSLSDTGGANLSAAQERQILLQLREPRHLSELVVEGVSAFNPHSQEAVRRFVGRLSEDGMASLVKDAAGNKTLGWKLSQQGQKLIKGDDDE